MLSAQQIEFISGYQRSEINREIGIGSIFLDIAIRWKHSTYKFDSEGRPMVVTIYEQGGKGERYVNTHSKKHIRMFAAIEKRINELMIGAI